MKEVIKKSSTVVVKINTATKKELMAISGVGDSLASKIIAKRTELGHFNKLEDVSEVPGLGPKGTVGKRLQKFAANFDFTVPEDEEQELDDDDDDEVVEEPVSDDVSEEKVEVEAPVSDDVSEDDLDGSAEAAPVSDDDI